MFSKSIVNFITMFFYIVNKFQTVVQQLISSWSGKNASGEPR